MELFVECLSRNFPEMTASWPFINIFLFSNLRQGIDGDIEVMLGLCVQNMSCFKRLMMFDLQIIQTTFVFIIYIAPTE